MNSVSVMGRGRSAPEYRGKDSQQLNFSIRFFLALGVQLPTGHVVSSLRTDYLYIYIKVTISRCPQCPLPWEACMAGEQDWDIPASILGSK